MAMLVLCLIGEQIDSIPMEDQVDICRKMGIQISLITKKEYKQALFKTTWEEFARNYKEFLSSIRAVSGNME
jgi:energy-converting hydrogenase A subunit M